MKRLLPVLMLTTLISCVNDNAAIRSTPDDTFRYTHWSQNSMNGIDNAKLHFINEYTNKAMVWKGDVRDAMVYLEQIDKGKCYKNPVSRDQAQEVPCD